MKHIQLTRGYVAMVDDGDYDLVASHKWYAQIARHRDGTIRTVYGARDMRTPGGHTTVFLHRFILGIADRKTDVDHRDRNGLDCQRENLRVCTRMQNSHNAHCSRRNKSGLKGAIFVKRTGMWVSSIKVDGVKIHLGSFTTAYDAAHAYDTAAVKHFGEFARLNFPPQAA